MSQTSEHRKSRVKNVAGMSLSAAVCLFVLLSLASFDIRDWPNPDVAPVSSHHVHHNLCGPSGAFVAYYCNYYLGPATFPLLAGMIGFFVLRAMGKSVDQLLLRFIGLVLIGMVFSVSTYLSFRGGEDSLAQGSGGILGIALGHFLLQSMAMTGAILTLGAAFMVGLLLTADDLLFFVPKMLWRGARSIFSGVQLASVNTGHFRLFRAKAAAKSADAEETPFWQDADSAEATALMEASDEEEEADEEYDEDEVEQGETEDEAEEPTLFDKVGDKEHKPREMSLENVQAALAKMRGRLPAPIKTSNVQEDYSDFQFPPLDLLDEPTRGYSEIQAKMVREKGIVLQRTLDEFNIDAKVVDAETGPVITLYEIRLAPGIKVNQIRNLSNDIARSLGAGMVRIVAPIPGKSTIGIEVPNAHKEKVRIKELLQLSAGRMAKMQIPLLLGKDASGEALTVDLTSMPHGLIAGTTGSGKSVCLNSIIISILLTQRPDMVKLILVDPKMVEMNAFRDIPHLMCPIVNEMKKAEQILEWLTIKMDERYALLAEAGARNIAGYNKLGEEEIYARFDPTTEDEKAKIPVRLPYLVVIIDELADLMMTSAKEVEGHIIRLAQKSRAVGIHILLATQRPQATVVTGLIKSNLPARISFRVSGRMDSRIVLDQNGAETLLGQGDMLFLPPGCSDLVRAQGTFLSDEEIFRIVKHLHGAAKPNYHPELMQLNTVCSADNLEKDELFDDAVRIILQSRRGSVSLLQRRLTIGYSRASRLIDQMAMAGIVGEYKGSQAREVLITEDEYELIRKQLFQDEADGFKDLQDDEGAALPTASVEMAEFDAKMDDEYDDDEDGDGDDVVGEHENLKVDETYDSDEDHSPSRMAEHLGITALDIMQMSDEELEQMKTRKNNKVSFSALTEENEIEDAEGEGAKHEEVDASDEELEDTVADEEEEEDDDVEDSDEEIEDSDEDELEEDEEDTDDEDEEYLDDDEAEDDEELEDEDEELEDGEEEEYDDDEEALEDEEDELEDEEEEEYDDEGDDEEEEDEEDEDEEDTPHRPGLY